MKTRRLLIASFIFLATGIGVLFGYCNGSAGFSAGYPISGTTLKLDLTITGFPAISGFLLTVFGLVLLIISGLAAVVAEIRSPRSKPSPENQTHLA